jgi:hypothetical protein
MAESKKVKAAKPKPKKAKSALAKKPAKKAPSKAKRPSPKPKAAPRRSFSPKTTTFNIADLIDHPLVADLLAVGAMAAVGAIADHHVKKRTGESESGSRKAIKAAGKAAATAVGKRLLTEVDAIKKASRPKRTKRRSR